jgi:hypothetical protein
MYEQYYKILECSPNDDPKYIRKQYLKLALKYHPDKNKDDGTRFREINEAYHKLTSSTPTEKYDKPIDLFHEILSHYDNDLADIIYDTLLLLIPNTTNIKDMWKQMFHISKFELIKSGTNIIKQYLERKCDNQHTDHNTYKLSLYDNDNDKMKDEYNIECSLDFLKKYSSIQLFINDIPISLLDLKYQTISIKYHNRIYDFSFIDKFISGFKRINAKYDLLLEINNVSIKNIDNIISINHPFLKDNDLQLSLYIASTSDIYLFNNIGIWNPITNNYSNIYISLSFIDNLYHNNYIKLTHDYMYKKPDKVLSIYDIINE